jgi:hypothetical protein
MEMTAPPPWYRQFWPWVLIGLPASAVVASLSTVYIAMQGEDSLVVDEYYKAGLAINRELGRDRAAAALGLSAEVSMTAGGLRVELASAAGTRPQSLELALVHPTLAERDRLLVLLPGADGAYYGQLEPLGADSWNVTLTPANGEWRLLGRWNTSASQRLTLQPLVDYQPR